LVSLIPLSQLLVVSGLGIPKEAHGRIGLTRRLRWAALACVVGMAVLLVGCGSSQTNNDTPVITGLFPSNATAGGPGFTLNVAGNGFISTSVVFWNNSQRTTTFNTTSTELSAAITAQDIASAGTAQVVVVTPSPGGGASSAVSFTINPAQNPLPAITSLSPSSTAVGVLPTGGVLTVNGTNFISTSVVVLNGNTRTTTFVSSTQLTVLLTAADVASNTTISVTVSNPSPGGGVSSVASFKVGTGSAVRIKASVAAAAAGPLPEVVSLSALGAAANGRSVAPAISSDGRFVAFYSTATNLLAQGPSGNIFVRDTCLGAANCTLQTIAVDLAPDGGAPNTSAEAQVAISGDGRFVAFASRATNVISNFQAATPPELNIYVRDLCTGADVPPICAPSTALVSVGANGSPAAGSSTSPSLSADGRFVAFVSTAPGLVAGLSLPGSGVYVRDTCSGTGAPVGCIPRTYSASFSLDAEQDTQHLADPVLSADGRYVAFDASNPADQSASQVFLADTCGGLNGSTPCVTSRMEISLAADGSSLSGSNRLPSVSADGRFVAFESSTSGGAPTVFLRDTCLGTTASADCVPSTALLSADVTSPSISASGRYISFVTVASLNSGGGGSISAGALYLYDTCFGATQSCVPQTYPISAGSAGSGSATSLLAAAASSPAPLTSDGSIIVFSSSAAIAGLPLSGQGDVLLTVAPF
jgi:Tol biopolymer transport system component